jgi:Glycosyltransferase family 10 (fucosyltransferase) C-term
MILSLDEASRKKLFDHRHKPKSSAYRFMVYTNSHCVQFRETAMSYFSDIGAIDVGGSCNGSTSQIRQPNAANVVVAPDHVRSTHWRENFKGMNMYRYCLVLENRYADGYISEKILNAFLGGCVPIYYGDRGVYDIFNKNAFIYYDIDNPSAALNRVRQLEANTTAYEEILAQPILAHGNRTIEQYFSLSDDIGNGVLKRRIHEMMGLLH